MHPHRGILVEIQVAGYFFRVHARHGIALRKREDKRSMKQLGQSNGDVAVNLQGLDALTKVAERSRKLVDLYAERIKMDDGYQVIDPRTVANAFQELAAKAAANPRGILNEQIAFWST
jgi:hypothetical protein